MIHEMGCVYDKLKLMHCLNYLVNTTTIRRCHRF